MIYIDVGQAIQYWYERREKTFQNPSYKWFIFSGKIQDFFVVRSNVISANTRNVLQWDIMFTTNILICIPTKIFKIRPLTSLFSFGTREGSIKHRGSVNDI